MIVVLTPAARFVVVVALAVGELVISGSCKCVVVLGVTTAAAEVVAPATGIEDPEAIMATIVSP